MIKLIVGTKNDPGEKVCVEISMKFTNVAALERWIKTQQIALEWFKKGQRS